MASFEDDNTFAISRTDGSLYGFHSGDEEEGEGEGEGERRREEVFYVSKVGDERISRISERMTDFWGYPTADFVDNNNYSYNNNYNKSNENDNKYDDGWKTAYLQKKKKATTTKKGDWERFGVMVKEKRGEEERLKQLWCFDLTVKK